MNFENSFTVGAPVPKVWETIMDFERVAPCMPGAQITERMGEDQFKVQVRVKVGPMSMVYRGQAEVTDRDDATRTAAMRVKARETRGQGSANAVVQIGLAEEGAGTRATMATDPPPPPHPPPMGRGVIADVSQALVSEFAENLARMLSESSGDGAGAHEPVESPVASSPAGAPPPPAPSAGPPPPSPPPPPPGPEASSAGGALDAGKLAKTIFASRLPDPRTVALLGLVCLAIGYRAGRRAGQR